MRKVIKLLLILLSYAPLATVAVAAQAKASEMDGEDQTTILRNEIRAARFRVIPDGHTSIAIEELPKRYKDLTGLQGPNLTQSMRKDLQLLIDHGVIQMNEKAVVGHGPSQFAL